jgi:hypothetical protein
MSPGLSPPACPSFGNLQSQIINNHSPLDATPHPSPLCAFASLRANHSPMDVQSSAIHQEIIYASLRDAMDSGCIASYRRTSLREGRHFRFAAERHIMVARPFKTATTSESNGPHRLTPLRYVNMMTTCDCESKSEYPGTSRGHRY